MNYFYWLNLRHCQKTLGKSALHGVGKSLRLQKCPYKVNLSSASDLSSFNMIQCSWTISSMVLGLISLLSWLVSDYQFLVEKLEEKWELILKQYNVVGSRHSFPFLNHVQSINMTFFFSLALSVSHSNIKYLILAKANTLFSILYNIYVYLSILLPLSF